MKFESTKTYPLFFAVKQSLSNKLIIYQLTLRLFGNKNTTNKPWGSLAENGTGKFSDLSNTALTALKSFGVSHIWPMGVIEHTTMEDFTDYGIPLDNPDLVKGRAGSGYAIKDYYDVNPYLADAPENRMKEFEDMVGRIHKKGLKIIIDFVPNHVAREYRSDAQPAGIEPLGALDNPETAFHPNNNFYYLPNEYFELPDGLKTPIPVHAPYIEFPARATGNNIFSAKPHLDDWYETVKLNYGIDFLYGGTTHFHPIPDTWFKMRNILLFWAEKGVDGFRCDMAEMVPVEFWAWCIPQIKEKRPVVFIAEVYNPREYHNYVHIGQFDYLYDKVGLYDAVRRLMEGHGNTQEITRCWQLESGDIDNAMLRFLENHDEQRIASPQFVGNTHNAIPAMLITATMGRGPVMYFFGQEVGEPATGAEGFRGDDGRTTMFDWWGVPEHQKWMNNGKFDGGQLSALQRKLYADYQDINQLCKNYSAIISGQFYDLQYVNCGGQTYGYYDDKMYSYIRHNDNEIFLFIVNFSHQSSETRIRIPEDFWRIQQKSSSKSYTFKEILHQKHQKGIFIGDIGLPVVIDAFGYLVFKIE